MATPGLKNECQVPKLQLATTESYLLLSLKMTQPSGSSSALQM